MRSSPVSFLRVFLSKVRRNGEGIGKTQMGSLLDGKLLDSLEWEGQREDDQHIWWSVRVITSST